MSEPLDFEPYVFAVGDEVVAYAGRHFGAAHQVVEVVGRSLLLRHMDTGDTVKLSAAECELLITPSENLPPMTEDILKAFHSAEFLCDELRAVHKSLCKDKPDLSDRLAEAHMLSLLAQACEIREKLKGLTV